MNQINEAKNSNIKSKKILIDTPREKSKGSVAVLLCCFKGKKYIAEQIDSIIQQDHKNISLWVSLDGDNDGSIEIIKERTKNWEGQLHIVKGPGKGFASNFLSLVCNPDIKADYYSFSDQDDIWEKNKISLALESLKNVPSSIPQLYCSLSTYIDEFGNELGKSNYYKRKPSFRNALVHCIAAGNTMVFNESTRDIIITRCKDEPVPFHDWLIYLTVSAVGGTIIYDDIPGLRYRQHGRNLYGENISFFARFRRIRMLLDGTFRSWTSLNIKALEKITDRMTPENKKVFDLYKNSRENWVFPRVLGFWKTGAYRHSFSQNASLYLACLLKRI